MRHVVAAMPRTKDNAEDLASPENMVRSDASHALLRRDTTKPIRKNAHRSQKSSTLPPASEIESLMEQYFNNTGLLFPYIHKTSFYETYEKLKQSPRHKVRRTWLGLLNMVLAMATYSLGRNSDQGTEYSAHSDEFFARAQSLCQNQMLRGTTLETGKSPTRD